MELNKTKGVFLGIVIGIIIGTIFLVIEMYYIIQNRLIWIFISGIIIPITGKIVDGIIKYYTAVKAPILLEARKRHMQELIEFLKEWYNKFPCPERATDPKSTPTPSTMVVHLEEEEYNFPKIERDWRYKDLIQNHLPKKYKTLPVEWEKYKKLINEYGTLRYELYKKIKKDAIKMTNLKYDTDWNNEHIISEYFVGMIYSQLVSWRQNGQPDYSKGFIINGCKINNNELWWDNRGLAKGNKEELEKARKIFEEIMFDKGYLSKYEQEINKIIEYKKILEEKKHKLKVMIKELRIKYLYTGQM